MNTTSIFKMTVRTIGLIQLVMGLVIWTGSGSLTLAHILLGSIFTLALLALTYQAYRAGVSRWLVILAAVWGLGLPIWGLTQENFFPASLFWVSQVLHLLCGLGAIGLAEILAAQMRKKSAKLS